MGAFIANLKGIHWTAIGLTVAAAFITALSQQQALAPVSGLLLSFAGALQAASVGTALNAHKVETDRPKPPTPV